MAASSPAKSNNGATDAAADAAQTPSSSNVSKSLRGLNKPKCFQCGNVARSRCPYQSCKNCCARAQNPCLIHVLKGNSSFPDKPPSSSSPLFDQQSTEASHSGNFHRLRQLSSNFAQFSNLQTPFRSRKPLTKKDAQIINEWRFLKLKEFQDRNIETETEAFDRYVQNVGLLEEIFLVNSVADDHNQDGQPPARNSSFDGDNAERVQVLKLNLGSNPVGIDNLRKLVQYIVDQGLMKLGNAELVDGTSDPEGFGIMTKKIKSLPGEGAIALSDLNDKLNKAINEDDLKACREAASEMFNWKTRRSLAEAAEILVSSQKDPKCDSSIQQQFYKNWVTPSTVDHEVLCRIDGQFSSLEEIEDL
ncbi:hypothetical protein OROGR_001747 [Orobanche gracilis]